MSRPSHNSRFFSSWFFPSCESTDSQLGKPKTAYRIAQGEAGVEVREVREVREDGCVRMRGIRIDEGVRERGGLYLEVCPTRLVSTKVTSPTSPSAAAVAL